MKIEGISCVGGTFVLSKYACEMVRPAKLSASPIFFVDSCHSLLGDVDVRYK